MAKKEHQPEPAIFYDVNGTIRADTCEPLKEAGEKGDLDLVAMGRGCYPGRPLPPKMMPELCTYTLWDAKHDQSWGLAPHRNEGIELGFLARGSLDFHVNDQCYNLTSGNLTVTRPWQLHQVGSPNVTASRMHWLIIDFKVRRPNDPWTWPEMLNFSLQDQTSLIELLRFNEQPVWKGNNQIEKCFENIAELTKASDLTKSQTRIQHYINALLIEVYEMLQMQNIHLDENLGSTKRSVEMFLDALPQHIEYPWTLESMARHCNLGRSRFTQYCKQITNQTPMDYLINCRLEQAKRLMQQSKELSITNIAFNCGFESSQYFATAFKKRIGVSPSEYRASKAS